MTLVANVKGYINWSQWGVWELQLLTYEQIVAMADDEWPLRANTIAELNSHWEDYYNSLTQWNHLDSWYDYYGTNYKYIDWLSDKTIPITYPSRRVWTSDAWLNWTTFDLD